MKAFRYATKADPHSAEICVGHPDPITRWARKLEKRNQSFFIGAVEEPIPPRLIGDDTETWDGDVKDED